MAFADKLKEVRKEKGFTQKDIYLKLNISANGYASWEQGRTEPSINAIRNLCLILEVSADYLLNLEDTYGNKIYYESTSFSANGNKVNYKHQKQKINKEIN